MVNRVAKLKTISNSTVKINKPVAIAPIGPIVSNGIPLSPGSLPITDELGIFNAFTVRSMGKVMDYDIKAVGEFEELFREVVNYNINNNNNNKPVEKDIYEFYEEHYTGKHTQESIKSDIEAHQQYSIRSINNKKMVQNSCFVKGENSSKMKDGKRIVKLRLIMVMSLMMLMGCIQVIPLFEWWNEGPMSQFQVKKMTLQQMSDTISNKSNCVHMVSDYSSFESSLDSLKLKMEKIFIYSLCSSCYFDKTKEQIMRYYVSVRQLKYKGSVYNISSRCSGDPWTSTGNGLFNQVAIMFMLRRKLYSELKQSSRIGVKFLYSKAHNVLVEGDDGLMPEKFFDKKIINSLGFDLSCELKGHYEGDVDFLSKRWKDGRVYLNIGKCLNFLWVKYKNHLKDYKQMHILRCMAYSLYHLSPNHPITSAMVIRIGKETAKCKKGFKNSIIHIKSNLPYILENIDIDTYNFPQPIVSEDMRIEVSKGGQGFPPIPIPIQLHIESVILNDSVMDIGNLLDNYPEVINYKESCNYSKITNLTKITKFKDLFDVVDMTTNRIKSIRNKYIEYIIECEDYLNSIN